MRATLLTASIVATFLLLPVRANAESPDPMAPHPDEDQAILLAIGRWLKVNGEAIYGTHYWQVFGEGPTSVSTGHVSEHKDKPFTAQDIRFTAKDDVLYATLLDWPASGDVTIKSLASDSPRWPGEIGSVRMLGSEVALTCERTEQGLTVLLPRSRPGDFALVLRLEP